MKQKLILGGIGCVVLGVLVGMLVSHFGKEEGQPEIQDPPAVIDINATEEDGPRFEITEDGHSAVLVDRVSFADHGVEYDAVLGEEQVLLAEAGVKTFVLSTCSQMSREVLSEYFTDWACQVIEQDYTEDFEGREAPQLEVVKSQVRDGCVEVFLKHFNYDQYRVYFKDGKIDNVEYVRTFFEESEF